MQQLFFLKKEIPKSRSHIDQTNDRKAVKGRVRGRDSEEEDGEAEDEREGQGRKGAHRECTVKGRVLTTSVGSPVDITAPASQHLERRRSKGQRDSHI